MAAHLSRTTTARCRTADDIPRRYARDMSMYRIPPAALIEPRSSADLAATLRAAADAGVTVTLRGGGSGTGGAALGADLVVSLEHLPEARILEMPGGGAGTSPAPGSPPGGGATHSGAAETDGRAAGVTARVGAAVRHDALQRALREQGHHMPADPSSGQLSLIGGNVATKASGAHALTTGAINTYVRSMRVMLPDGRVVDTADPATIPARLRDGLRGLRRAVLADNSLRTRLETLRGRKIASGYNFPSLLDVDTPPGMIEQLMCGSAGTLGVVIDVTLAGVPIEAGAVTLLVPVEGRGAACELALTSVDRGAAAVELIDAEALVFLRDRGVSAPAGKHLLYVELRGDDLAERRERIFRAAQSTPGVAAAEIRVAESAEEQERIWELRKRLLLFLRQASAPYRALSVVNDVGVPPGVLPRFIDGLVDIFRDEGLTAPIYGHAGSGNLHLRPLFDTSSPGLRRQVRRVADRVYDLTISMDGTITAEHGMGRLRAPYLEAEWGPEACRLFGATKELFDPKGVLNPEALFYRGEITAEMDL